jgi:Fe-S cluster biogenesis protein NfuA
MQEDREFQKRMQKIEALTGEIEALTDENARKKAIELMRLLMEYHGAAIERVMEIVAERDRGGDIFDDLSEDGLSSSLLMLYGLHPVEIETRVERAIEKVRPTLAAHGGDAELIGIDEGIVRLRLIGSCNGCPSSSITLKQTIEQAIYEAAPEIAAIETEGETKPAEDVKGFVQIQRVCGVGV